MKPEDAKEEKLMRVGELAKAVGKTVRAMHLYEELGLLDPDSRSEGGFRLYNSGAIERIQWITKLQAIGFTLAEIQGFVREFRDANSGREASSKARDVFVTKVASIREQIAQLQMIENDLLEAVAYLDSCQQCAPHLAPSECGGCGHEGHHPGEAPRLFAGLSQTAKVDRREFDVPVTVLYREGNN
jgi:MerR family transcriptional regulator, copper efflux regulator